MVTFSRRRFLQLNTTLLIGSQSRKSTASTLEVPRPASRRYTKIGGVSYYYATSLSSPWSLVQSSSNHMQRFEVRSGDVGYDGDARTSNERAELVTVLSQLPSFALKFQRVHWLSYRFSILSERPITSATTICGQVHDVIDPMDKLPLGPIFCFNLGKSKGGTVPIAAHIRSDRLPITNIDAAPKVVFETALRRFTTYSFLVRIKPSFADDAELDIWLDHRQVLSLTGINIGFNNTSGPLAGYWQYGVYRSRNEHPLVVSYSDMRQYTD